MEAKKKSANRYGYLLLLLFVAAAGALLVMRKGDQPPAEPATTAPTEITQQASPSEAAPSIAPVEPEQEMAAIDQSETQTLEPAAPAAPVVKKKKKAQKKQPELAQAETTVVEVPPAPVPEEQKPPEEQIARTEEPLPNIELDQAQLTVVFKDELRWFKPMEVDFLLDGQPLVERKKLSGIDTRNGVPIFIGELPPGEHTFTVRTRLTGDSKMFPYMKEYTFTAQKGGTIRLQPRDTRLIIRAKASEDITKEWQDRIWLDVALEAVAQPAA